MRSRWAPPARCRRTSCASSSATTRCQAPDMELALRFSQGSARARILAPGVLACGVVGAASAFLAEHYGAPVMLFALLLGMAMNFLSADGACRAGIDFSAKQMLRIGIALLGLRITVGQVAALGWGPLALVVICVVLTIVVSM